MHDIHHPPSIPLGEYLHYKGNYYTVEGLSFHTETQEWLVLYRRLFYDEFNQRGPGNVLFARPAAMFVETVGDKPRFQKV